MRFLYKKAAKFDFEGFIVEHKLSDGTEIVLVDEELSSLKTLLLLGENFAKDAESLTLSLGQHVLLRNAPQTLMLSTSMKPNTEKPLHHVRFNCSVKEDLRWLYAACNNFNGTVALLYGCLSPSFSLSTDACLTEGSAFFAGNWFYVNWKIDYPHYDNLYINLKELTVLVALKRWCHALKDSHVLVYTDNIATRWALQEGLIRNQTVTAFLLKMLLKGVHKLSGRPPKPKLPITPTILRKMQAKLDMSSFDKTFWHGHIHLCLKELVLEKFGKEAWVRILDAAGCDDETDFMLFHHYEDEKTMLLVQMASKELDIDIPSLLYTYGEYFYTYAYRRGYDKMMMTLGHDFQSFVDNLNFLHSLLALTYKGMKPPHFGCERINGRVYVHIRTVRPGLYKLAIGLLTAVAKNIFNTDVELTITNKEKCSPGSKYSEHVVTLVTILGSQGKETHSFVDTTPDSADKVDKEDITEHQLISIPKHCIRKAVPFSMVFNRDMIITDSGPHLNTFCPKLQNKNTKFESVFSIKDQAKGTCCFASLKNSPNQTFYLNYRNIDANSNANLSDHLVLRGKMVPVNDGEEIMFVGTPYFDSLGDLLDSETYLSKIPQDKITMEIMFMNEQRKADVEMSKKLDQSTATMKKLAIALTEEKKRTDCLLYEMLPQKVADKLRDGQVVDAEKYESATILFSDIVTFTDMASMCEPMDVVGVLNQLFKRFDYLTTKHLVYKVETIGDAYMVVSGVPEKIANHAARMSAMAIDMLTETAHVKSPVSGNAIQIRIGMHTGPVVSGVVGTKMPRFCLFGDTVNTASRMESHGLPGKIHISEATFQELVGHAYRIESRGAISVKGKGMMNTYFVTGTKENSTDSVDDAIYINCVSDSSEICQMDSGNFEMGHSFAVPFSRTPISQTRSEFCLLL
ncbi:hypothetical protein ScPMuIL_009042 [Solemya velum]